MGARGCAPLLLALWAGFGALTWHPIVARAGANFEGSSSQDATARSVVTVAQKYLGVPYVWGGQGVTGFDCSGFVGHVYRQLGYNLPRVSRQQALVGLAVHYNDLMPGDLLFFAEQPHETRITHVAISLGGSRFIHAALGRGAVSYDHLGERYYASRLVAARRLVILPPGNYSTTQGQAPQNLMATSQDHMKVLAQQFHKDPQNAQQSATEPIPIDMLLEHAGQKLPAQLMILGSKENILGGTYDGFEPASWAPEDTGIGMRLGVTRAPTNTPGFLLLSANAMVVPWGLWAALRMPVLWPMWGATPSQDFAFVPWRSARQWGRLLYGATLGSPGARLYVALDRSAALTLGMGLVMRHFVPGAQSTAVDDLLVAPNPLGGTVQVNLNAISLAVVADDVLAPRVFGAHVQLRPHVGAKGNRLTLSLAWAADVRAPNTGLSPPTKDAYNAIHGVELALSLLAWDGAQTQLRPYVALASLQTTTPHRPLKVGGAMGATWALYHGQFANSEHTLTLRGEARIHQGGFLPSYFSFGYRAARLTAFVDDNNPKAKGPSKLAVLLNQGHGPGRASGLIEAQYALARRLQFGVRYEDGGPLQPVPAGIANPSDRTLSVYMGLHNQPLPIRHMLLHVHGLWHKEQSRTPWPGHSMQAAHAYTQLTAKLDLAFWLDAVATVVHPMGVQPVSSRAWVGAMSVNAHANF